MKYKAIYSVLIAITVISIVFSVPTSASDSSYNWYCVHRKDHLQPRADYQLSFVKEYNGYYIDESHGDNCVDKVIYLTFDAGYENGNVSKILDVMKDENVHAAFFVLGNLVEKCPDLVKRMFDEGHLVCNHTFSHRSIVGMDSAKIKEELSALEESCFKMTGKSMSKYFRPPEGRFDRESLSAINDLGYKTVFWSFAYADWDNSKQMNVEQAKNKILENIHNGEIMLLHPTSATNAEILRDVIRELKNQGYRFGSLDEL